MSVHHVFFQTLLKSQSQICTEVCNKVLYITITNESKLNALSIPMYHEITNLLNNAQTDDKIRVIVIKSRGKYFSTGNDLQNFSLFPDELMRVILNH